MTDLPGPVGALADVRVVDASTILAGPFTCQLLGEYGAEVIKVEHPDHGDGLRGHGTAAGDDSFLWKSVNRNKRSIGLRINTAQGAELLLRLVRDADVLVENFRPGTLDRWGLSLDKLHEVNPRLVVLRITGFGQEGPYRDRRAFGTLTEAMSGFAASTGEPDGPPQLPPFGLADSIAGVAGAAAVSLALYERERSGVGQEIDLSILEPIMAAVGVGPTVYEATGELPQRAGNRSTNNAPRNLYRTRDERWVAVSTSSTSVAERVMRLVGHEDVIGESWFATGQGRVAHGELLDGAVASWISARDQLEVIERFTEAGAAAAPVYTAADILEDEQVVARGVFERHLDDDVGEVVLQAPFLRFSRTPGRVRSVGPALGSSTDAILDEIGIDEPSRVALRSAGVIR